MTIDTSFLITGRQMRTQWREQEEDYIAESLSFTKRNISLLDFLASVAHAGNEISVRTPHYESSGPLIHIGKDFFSIVSASSQRLVHSFVLNDNSKSDLPKGIEIEVLGRSPKAGTIRLHRQNKSFRSLLDDISTIPDHNEIETLQGNVYEGTFELYADCIVVTENANIRPNQTMIRQGAIVIPIDGIVSVLYAV